MSRIHAYVANVYRDGSNIDAIGKGDEPMVGPYHDAETLHMAEYAMRIGGGNPWLIAGLCECPDDERAAR